MTHNSTSRTPQVAPGTQHPGTFQRMLLRAFQLPQAYRDVFLLKQIQGYTMKETAAILGISIDTAWIRLKRARRAISRWENSEVLEPARV